MQYFSYFLYILEIKITNEDFNQTWNVWTYTVKNQCGSEHRIVFDFWAAHRLCCSSKKMATIRCEIVCFETNTSLTSLIQPLKSNNKPNSVIYTRYRTLISFRSFSRLGALKQIPPKSPWSNHWNLTTVQSCQTGTSASWRSRDTHVGQL